jgi:hypothetical protein
VKVADFRFFAVQIVGTDTGWIDAIARKLDVDTVTVRGWLETDRLPDWIESRLAELIIGGPSAAGLPDDAWIIGNGATEPARRYVVHLHPPRFVARIANGQESKVRARGHHRQSGRIGDATVVDDVVWIDPPPKERVDRLLRQAAEVAREGDRQTQRPDT